ncbi:hypothetical protein LAZ67_4003247 [Cordylochernes scorpioides]|uniref:EF-hand domain-containing protein n=1 Tax=Cordylochernes scorpioides TaxID=51811 RepID=A0ABY6KDH1_9ARAC|nr:hypothetical protein LAZ67_4003247 [Cordylochernes scorpioides]
MSKKSKSESSKKKATRATSNVFAMFEQNQIAEFKELTIIYVQAFQLIDQNKDGFIDKNDLRATFDSLERCPLAKRLRREGCAGRLLKEEELDGMIAEAPGPINFTMFLTIFGDRVSGTDPEDVIKKAFKTFDAHETGKVKEDYLKKFLMTFGEKFKEDEVDEVFKEAPIDKDGNLDINEFIKLICGSGKDDEEGA